MLSSIAGPIAVLIPYVDADWNLADSWMVAHLPYLLIRVARRRLWKN
jgi:hypothetical protein